VPGRLSRLPVFARSVATLRQAQDKLRNLGGGGAHSVARKLTYTFLNPATPSHYRRITDS